MTDVLIGVATVTVIDGVGDTAYPVTFCSVVTRGNGNPADSDDAAVFSLGDSDSMTDVWICGATVIDGLVDTADTVTLENSFAVCVALETSKDFKNECECFIGDSNTRKLMRPSAFLFSSV